MQRFPSMSSLRAFEATIRRGGITKAAGELNVTDGAISRALRELETLLGFPLFNRDKRQLIATPAGRALANDVHAVLDDLKAAMVRAHRSAVQNQPLVLSCEPTFLIRWLIPRLPSLQAALGPECQVQFMSAGGVVPFRTGGIDLAIRRRDFEFTERVHVAPFLVERVGPVCRPPYHDMNPSRGITSAILHTETRPDAWATWAERTGIGIRPEHELRFEHFYLSLQAAAAGAGMAIGPIALVADDLRSGTLCAPFGFVEDGSEYVLMAPGAGPAPAAFETILEWLRTCVRDLDDFT